MNQHHYSNLSRTVSLGRLLCHCSALVLLIASSGCIASPTGDGKSASGWDLRKAVGLKSEEPSPQTPSRIVSTWTDTVLHKQGSAPKRGFGGRLLFFEELSDQPVRVDGQLVVYAFDDEGRAAHETQPTRRFIFPPEQFVRHESPTELGSSYSVWLPWDQVGGPQKTISLIARFEPRGGPVVMGEQTHHLLPGTTLAETGGLARPATDVAPKVRTAQHVSQLSSRSGVQHAFTPVEQPPAAVAEKKMTVTSIRLPNK